MITALWMAVLFYIVASTVLPENPPRPKYSMVTPVRR